MAERGPACSTWAELPGGVRSLRNPSTTDGANGIFIAAPVLYFGMCLCAPSRPTSALLDW